MTLLKVTQPSGTIQTYLIAVEEPNRWKVYRHKESSEFELGYIVPIFPDRPSKMGVAFQSQDLLTSRDLQALTNLMDLVKPLMQDKLTKETI